MSDNALMIPKSGDFVAIDPPAKGAHHAICCEVYDRGMVEDKFGGTGTKHKIWLVFRVNELIEGTDSEFDGKWKEVRISRNWALGPKSWLRQLLESWRGEPLTDDDFENGGFNIRKVEGVQATIVVGSWSDPDENGRQWANDVSVLPAVYEPADAKRLKINIAGVNEMTCDGYVTIDERKKETTDFPPKEVSKSAAASSSKKPPAPF